MRILKKLTFFVLSLLILAPGLRTLAADPPPLESKAAILIDLESGEVIFENNIHDKLFPASITKIMTFLVIQDLGTDLTEIVTVEEYMLEDLNEAGSTANLKPGEQLSVRDLIECMLISSGNDAANVLAIHCFGSLDAFVIAMNSKADSLECENTHYMNPHGLHDEEHFTTVADIVKITKEALKYDIFVETVATDIIKQAPTNMNKNGRTLVNTNNLLTKYRTSDYYYSKATGVKTGFTTPAGNCLVATAKNGNFNLLSVVMGALRDEETDMVLSYTDTIALFDWGFENFTRKTILKSTENIVELPVTLAQDNDYVVLTPETDITAIVPKDLDPADIERVVDVPESVEAPVGEGEVYGSLTLKVGGKEYGSTNLIALSGAERSAFLEFLQNTKKTLSNPSVIQGILIIVGVIVAYIALMIIVNVAKKQKKAKKLAREVRASNRMRTPEDEFESSYQRDDSDE